MTRNPTYEGKVANRVEVISESLVLEVTGMQRAVTHLTRLEIPAHSDLPNSFSRKLGE